MRDHESHFRGDPSTDRDRAEAEHLCEMLDLAVSLRRDALDDITARVAHELNQPLSVIVSSVRGAARRLEASGTANARILQALEKAAVQTKRAAQVVERVRAELGVEQSVREALDVGRIARAALCTAAPVAAARGVGLEAAVDERPLPALGDPRRLRHALLVLLLEGIGGAQAVPGPAPSLSLRATGHGASIVITLCYRGANAGTSAEAAARALSAPAPACDTGLTLGFVRSVVAAHGGRLEVPDERRSDQASVHIRLPSTAIYGGDEQP